MFALVDGLVTADESGPAAGVPKLAGALRAAVAERCSEAVTSALADSGGRLLSQLGDHPRAVRLLAAGSSWRGDHPRPAPERHEAELVEAAALTALGRARFEAEHVTGSSFTAHDAVQELAEALRDHTAHRDSTSASGR